MPGEPTADRTPRELATDLVEVMREHNALMARYGPAIEEFVRIAKATGGVKTVGPDHPASFGEYVGKALVDGKFDPFLSAIQSALGGTYPPTPPKRPRRRS